MKINHRGVQQPGYNDPVTKRFIFVKEMFHAITIMWCQTSEMKLKRQNNH